MSSKRGDSRIHTHFLHLVNYRRLTNSTLVIEALLIADTHELRILTHFFDFVQAELWPSAHTHSVSKLYVALSLCEKLSGEINVLTMFSKKNYRSPQQLSDRRWYRLLPFLTRSKATDVAELSESASWVSCVVTGSPVVISYISCMPSISNC